MQPYNLQIKHMGGCAVFYFLLIKSASRIWIAGVWERWDRGKLNPDDDCYLTACVLILENVEGSTDVVIMVIIIVGEKVV